MVVGERMTGEEDGIVEAKREGEGGEEVFLIEAQGGVFLAQEFLF
jgi:hypothetical protein